MKHTITREFWFSASHMIEGHPKCGRLHGHNYKVVVYLTGDLDKRGMVLDFAELDKVVKPLIEELDHYTLFSESNIQLQPELYQLCQKKGWSVAIEIPATTAEWLSWFLHSKIYRKLRVAPKLVKVLVQETPKSEAIYEE